MIRRATAGDVPAIYELVNRFAAKGDLLPRSLDELYERLRDFVVWEEGGAIAGVCSLWVYQADLAEIRSLAVREESGGRGIGSRLTEACLQEAAALGIRRVFTLTYKPHFFERLGFRVVDKLSLPQKIWKDCIVCAKFPQCDETALMIEIPSRGFDKRSAVSNQRSAQDRSYPARKLGG